MTAIVIHPDKYHKSSWSCMVCSITDENMSSEFRYFLSRFMDCVSHFKSIQEKKYSVGAIETFKKDLDKFEIDCIQARRGSHSNIWELYHAELFIKEVLMRISRADATNLNDKRRVSHALGRFDDSISPRMTQRVFTWLRKKFPLKFKPLFIGKKEDILYNLRKKGIQIDVSLLSEFIRDECSDPTKYLKEWSVPLYKDGIRQTNKVLRELLVVEFYRRSRNYLRLTNIFAHMRGMPSIVEEHIQSYLIE